MHRGACKRLNLDWLESLNALHACGQFNLAAKQLGISQSTLFQSIAKIEESIGLPLVVRHSPVHLTPSGHRPIAYLQRARTDRKFNRMKPNMARFWGTPKPLVSAV